MKAPYSSRHSALFGLIAAGMLGSSAIPIGVGDLGRPAVEAKKGKCERTTKSAPATIKTKAAPVGRQADKAGDRGFRLFRFLL